MNAAVSVILALIVVIIIVGAAILLTSAPTTTTTTPTTITNYTTTSTPVNTTTTTTPPANQSTPVVLTDPPTVPAGTNALVMSYSNVMVHSTGTGTTASGWISASGSGNANLTAMNSSAKGQVLASARTTTNSSINAVSYTITSAKITVNGTTYNVMLPPNSTVAANVTGTTTVNSTSAVAINTSPVITSSKNTTTNTVVYAWVGGTTKAFVYSNSTFTAQANANVGGSISLNASLVADLEAILGITLRI